MEDLSRTVFVIFGKAGEFGIDTTCNSVWGGSAGARLSAWLGTYGPEVWGGEEVSHVPQHCRPLWLQGLAEVTWGGIRHRRRQCHRLRLSGEKVRKAIRSGQDPGRRGGMANASFLADGLIDEISLFVAHMSSASEDGVTIFDALSIFGDSAVASFKPVSAEVLPSGAVNVRWERG